MRAFFKPDAIGVQKAPWWSLDGGGYTDEFDNWHHTGNYTSRCTVWIGHEFPGRDGCGYQPSNRIYLQMRLARAWTRRSYYCNLAVCYCGTEITLDTFRARSIAQAQRKALWRWRNGDHGGLANVWSHFYRYRTEVWRMSVDSGWQPFATAFARNGMESPGTPLGMGTFCLWRPNDAKPHTLNVGPYGTGGSFGGEQPKAETLPGRWLERLVGTRAEVIIVDDPLA